MRWNKVFCFEFEGMTMETEIIAWSEFPNGEKTIVEQILASEERNQNEKGCESHNQGPE